MNTCFQNTAKFLMLGSLVGMGSALPSIALAEDGSPWSVKAYGVLSSINESFDVDRTVGGRIEADSDGALGFGGAVEYRLNELIGLEASLSYNLTPDIDADFDQNDSSTEVGEGPSFSPVQFAVNFHFLNTGKLDVYAGPRIAWVSFGDFDLEVDGQQVDYEADDEFGLGAAIGVSYQVGDSPVSLVAEVAYLDVEMNVTEVGTNTTESLDFNPISSNFGIRYQF